VDLSVAAFCVAHQAPIPIRIKVAFISPKSGLMIRIYGANLAFASLFFIVNFIVIPLYKLRQWNNNKYAYRARSFKEICRVECRCSGGFPRSAFLVAGCIIHYPRFVNLKSIITLTGLKFRYEIQKFPLKHLHCTNF
jgi:hypothetical protein